MYGLTGSNLGVAGFSNLNGLAAGANNLGYGYGSYGLGFMGYGTNVTDTAKAKEQMQNSYSIYATQQGLQNKQNVETMSFAQQSNNVNILLSENRNNAAMQEYEKLVQNIKASPQFSSYSDVEIRAIAQAQYQNATGTTLVNDIHQKSSSSFVQGLKNGVPILGWFFASGKSREDLISQVTGTPVSAKDQTAKIFGACTSGALVAGGAVAGFKALDKTNALTTLKGFLSKSGVGATGKVGIAVAAAAAVVGIGATVIKTITGSKD